jgi:hypothetical protein
VYTVLILTPSNSAIEAGLWPTKDSSTIRVCVSSLKMAYLRLLPLPFPLPLRTIALPSTPTLVAALLLPLPSLLPPALILLAPVADPAPAPVPAPATVAAAALFAIAASKELTATTAMASAADEEEEFNDATAALAAECMEAARAAAVAGSTGDGRVFAAGAGSTTAGGGLIDGCNAADAIDGATSNAAPLLPSFTAAGGAVDCDSLLEDDVSLFVRLPPLRSKPASATAAAVAVEGAAVVAEVAESAAAN